MPRGPLGAPRPFSEYRIIIDPHETEVRLVKVGPLGGPRPFAKNNPEVPQERVEECLLSEAGQNFAAGVMGVDNIEQLPPEQREVAMEYAESWCEGILEATAIENADFGEISNELEVRRSRLGV